MFRKFSIIISSLLLILLCSCAAHSNYSSDAYTVSLYGNEYLINRAEHVIIHNETSYKFDISGNRVTVTFPDGSTYWETQQGDSSFGGWSDDFNMYNYSLASNLIEALDSEMPPSPQDESSNNIWAAFILIILGGFSLAFPYASWYISYGWRYKNAEPSDTALIMARISGGIAVIVGVGLFFI